MTTNASTTLQNLIDRIRRRTNNEQSQFVTDAELTDEINSSLSELDDLLIAESADYKLKEVEVTITDSTLAMFPLPDDFLKSRGVSRQFGGRWMTLDRYFYSGRDIYEFPYLVAPYGDISIFYKIEDGYCRIIPTQNSAGTYRLGYIPDFTYLVDPSDSLPAYMDTNSWCEYAVVDVCIKVLAKDNLDPGTFQQQKASLTQRIVNAAKNRDEGPPKTIQNTRSQLYRRRRR